MATLDTGMSGFYLQNRVGYEGKIFQIIKIRTHKRDISVSKFGGFLKKSKLNELPQLFNVIIGDMSFVGPRPDIRGYADKLEGEDRIVLSVRPGITGPASLKYIDENLIISSSKLSNSEIVRQIWEDKVRINKEYVRNRNILLDVKYIIKTVALTMKK